MLNFLTVLLKTIKIRSFMTPIVDEIYTSKYGRRTRILKVHTSSMKYK